MSKSLNKVMIIGHAGSEPESRSLKNGGNVTHLSVATSDSRKDFSGNKIEHTEWHSVVFFNQVAEIVLNYVKKGSKVYIEGSLRTSKWQDKDGIERNKTEIVGNQIIILDSKETDRPMNRGQYGQNLAASNLPKREYQHTGKIQYSNDDEDMPF